MYVHTPIIHLGESLRSSGVTPERQLEATGSSQPITACLHHHWPIKFLGLLIIVSPKFPEALNKLNRIPNCAKMRQCRAVIG